MENIFRELKERYIAKKNDLMDELEPQKYWLFEILSLSKPKKSEDNIEHQLKFYDEFITEIDAFQELRHKNITDYEWSSLKTFLRISSENISSRIDRMGYVTAVCSIFAAVSLFVAKSHMWSFIFPFVISTWFAYQIHVHRVELRRDAAANREMLIIFEEYLKNKS